MWGEPVQFPPTVKGVGGPISHGRATFARRVHESGAGASRVNRLLAFSCCSGAVCGGGRWASAVASHLIQPRDHVWSSASHGAEHGHGRAEFRAIRVGRSLVVSGPRPGVCCPLTVPVVPRAFRFQKHQRLFFAVIGRLRPERRVSVWKKMPPAAEALPDYLGTQTHSYAAQQDLLERPPAWGSDPGKARTASGAG